MKFILTERQPEKWAASINNTAGKLATKATEFPFSILKYFDSTLYEFLTLNILVYRAIAGGTAPGEPGNEEALCRYYRNQYVTAWKMIITLTLFCSIKSVKETISADRLCLIQLEDGLGWETICPFLGLPVPDQAYPDRNEPEKFQVLVEGFITPRINTAIMRFSVVAVSTVGVVGWVAVKYGPSAFATLRGN